jgi:S-adenosylmethionine:tRNA ribosyltransferase-isomerase
MMVSDFDYALPPGFIAQHPAERRDASRLLVCPRDGGAFVHLRFNEIGSVLRAGDLLVLNDTRVVPARLFGEKGSGGQVEVLFARPLAEGEWEAMVRGRSRVGTRLILAGGRLTATVVGIEEGPFRRLRVDEPERLDAVLGEAGQVPLPPYIERPAGHTVEDLERYQTVFAERPGAVAAPTAGLHFTAELLDRLRRAGVDTAHVTLHVGPGTFRPVEVEEIKDHRMATERFSVGAGVAARIAAAKGEGRRVIACGTTVTRVLETLWRRHGAVVAGEGETDLFLYPGEPFGVIDGLITNFHLPRSTLIMLVAAFASRERVLEAYAEAIQARYRFYSYGDAMVVL